jgi:hypothetical protein
MGTAAMTAGRKPAAKAGSFFSKSDALIASFPAASCLACMFAFQS